MDKNEQSVGKGGWRSFNGEDNTDSSSSDLVYLLWEYIVLVKPKKLRFNSSEGMSVSGSRKKKKPPHFEEAVFCPESPGDISSPFQKSLCLSNLPKHSSLQPFPHTLPNLPATPSAPPAPIHCSSHCLLSKSPTFVPCSRPLRLVFMLVESHMTSGLLQSATGTDQTPVKSHYLLPERWHIYNCSAISRKPECHPNTLATVFPTSWL